MRPLHFDLSSLVRFDLDDGALERLAWKDFGNGTRIARLVRDGDAGLVVYRLGADAGAHAFEPHAHPGGEAYLVLRGAVVDASGTYPAGSLVWMEPNSMHAPHAAEGQETIIVVLWPAGVRKVPTTAP